MSNPYYFSGVSDPYMEIYALVDSLGNIIMLDQNLFMLKMLEMIPFTNQTKVVKLSSAARNYKAFKKHLSNENCTKFAVIGYHLVKSIRDNTQLQAKLFELRHKYATILEDSISNDFHQTVIASSFMMFMFGNNPNTKELVFTEIDRFKPECEQFNALLKEIYELL